MEFGEVIRSYRKLKGLRQEELAEQTGTTQPYISMLESGAQEEPHFFTTLRKMSKALDVPFAFLLFSLLKEEDVAENKRELLREIKPLLVDLVRPEME